MSVQLMSRRLAAKNVLAAGGACLAAASVAESAQPNMHAALKALNNAQNALQNALPDKAGHREKAIKLIIQAIEQVQLGIEAGK